MTENKVVTTDVKDETVITSAQNGNFSAGSTWVGGVAPVDGDGVVIASGHTVTIDGEYTGQIPDTTDVTPTNKVPFSEVGMSAIINNLSEEERARVSKLFAAKMKKSLKKINSKKKSETQTMYTKPPKDVRKTKARAKRVNQKAARRKNRA